MNRIFALFLTIALIIGTQTVYAQKEHVPTGNAVENKKLVVDRKNTDSLYKRYIGEEEKKLLARLVHAEAKGEPYVGKVAVAKVVLNRVGHEQFPDTVEEVIYQRNAFEPVQNGSIKKPASEEAVKAVEEALADHERNGDVVYFYNPDTATSDWIFTRQVVKKIGNHAFAI
ncbi:cell wall hydrolase [Bacillus sp. FJAT-27251]|uniref:cell wall hydrolase n=1 Tax=Bacillus sp. FJAT-27251 TaxID=1684142 RepID=UPI0006A7BD91|nr:cell wall hydrolase [Bacillus sp. FJAT-27251]